MKTLKLNNINDIRYTKDLVLPQLVTCSVCNGDGILSKNEFATYPCPVCNGSGVCKKGHEKNWSKWQIEEMKKEHQAFVKN